MSSRAAGCSHIEAGVFTVRLLVHLPLVPVLIVLWKRGEGGGGGGEEGERGWGGGRRGGGGGEEGGRRGGGGEEGGSSWEILKSHNKCTKHTESLH